MSEFNEQYKSPHIEPAFGKDGTCDDFYERLSEVMDDSRTTDHAGPAQMSQLIGQLFDWLTHVNLNDPRCIKSMGMRVLAAGWVLNPNRFGNRSLHNIALQLGFGPNNIAPLTAAFSRRFNVTNQFQSHNWRTKNAG